MLVMVGLFQASVGRAQTPDFIEGPPPDPVLLPLSGAAGVFVGGLVGGGGALALALVAQGATGDEATAESRTLNQLATFGTLVAPALLSVVGGVVGAGLGSGLVGAMTVGFGATVGAALGTGLALVAVPLGDAAGGPLGATAAIGGIVVGAAALGAAVAGLVAALTASGADGFSPNDGLEPADATDQADDQTDQGAGGDDADADAVGSDAATINADPAH